MDDDIQLPPLPPKPPVTDPDAAMQAYGRACYKAGVVIGERRAKVDAKPMKIHSRTLRFTDDGNIFREHENVTAVAVITLHWTNDGRVWIWSEQNRELAQKLRANGYLQAADALDGGAR